MRQLILSSACALAMVVGSSSVKAEETEPVYSPNIYLSAAGGAVFLGAERLMFPAGAHNYDFDTGFAVQGAVGTQLPMNFRTELEVTYRENDLKNSFTIIGIPLDSTGDVSAVTVMANVLYDFQLFDQFKLFAGGGIGVASIHLDFKRGPGLPGFVLANGNDNRFAYQAIAGASFEVFDGVSIFGKYSYLGPVDKLDSQII
ncbi:MAG: porin family protein [Alphaproteobacteria bacterium]|nr:porin family protein [Alphaproteobacteria bacterium]